MPGPKELNNKVLSLIHPQDRRSAAWTVSEHRIQLRNKERPRF